MNRKVTIGCAVLALLALLAGCGRDESQVPLDGSGRAIVQESSRQSGYRMPDEPGDGVGEIQLYIGRDLSGVITEVDGDTFTVARIDQMEWEDGTTGEVTTLVAVQVKEGAEIYLAAISEAGQITVTEQGVDPAAIAPYYIAHLEGSYEESGWFTATRVVIVAAD